jgi:ABC-type nitrate/sulfonate/bicarbonate transport system substrate-binding protein
LLSAFASGHDLEDDFQTYPEFVMPNAPHLDPKAHASTDANRPARTLLRVNVFNTSSNLPLLAAIEAGYFDERGLHIEVHNTLNSDEQRAGLAAGRFEIAHAAVDNAVALVEAGHDAVIVCGGDAGMNDFMVRAEINRLDDLRGKLLAVDAPNTAYALAAKKILKNHGLLEGRDYAVKLAGGTGPRAAAMVADPELAAGMINPPFSFLLRQQGLKSLGSQFDLLGPYQATGAFVMRNWAGANAESLAHYLAAYVRGQRDVMNPARRSDMLALLARSFKLSDAVAEGTYAALVQPGSGLAPDAAFSLPGFATVLAIRAEMEGMWGGQAPAPDKYLDLSFYARALGTD